MLAIGACQRIDKTELSGDVGREDGSEPLDAGVTIGGIAPVQLVTAAAPLDVLVVENAVKNRIDEVSGHPEDVRDVVFLEARKYVLNDGLAHDSLPGYWCSKKVGNIAQRKRFAQRITAIHRFPDHRRLATVSTPIVG
jgi:hypothetical protein